MINKPRKIKTVVLFGGAGLVGYQVARQISEYICPNTITICSLTKKEAQLAAKKLKKEFPNIKNINIEYGNLFVREKLSFKKRSEIINNDKHLDTVFNDIFCNISSKKSTTFQQSLMTKIILKHKPDLVVDCINTASSISYQDIELCSQTVKKFCDTIGTTIKNIKKAEFENKEMITKLMSCMKDIHELLTLPSEGLDNINNLKMLEVLLISQNLPQLIRHVILLYKALVAANTHMYIKVGTTGTGGMGINIPYTHGENKPSFTLMSKTAVAFAQTGLLFLLSRTPDAPIVKEIKPGAMIGHRKIDFCSFSKNGINEKKWKSKKEVLENMLTLRDEQEKYRNKGDLKLVGIDTGENGFFACGEYETITYPGSMEFVTPEDIAKKVLLEITGDHSGKDVISAINSSIMDPSYHAGVIRKDSINKMQNLEKDKGIPSVALGKLGPPQLSKLLYEAYLFKQKYGSIKTMAKDKISPKNLSCYLEKYILENPELQMLITSIGIPILLQDNKTILRGPKISIPESKISTKVPITSKKDIDKWAKTGWVDLRVTNMRVWQKRAKKMLASSQTNPYTEGTACYNNESYMSDEIKVGEVVGWIFANEFDGYRIK